MVIGPDFCRGMRADEEDEVDALLRAAFGGPEEAVLVRALRGEGAMVVEMVLPWAGRIGAYAAVSRMVEPPGWLSLAPVAVLPEWQRGALGRRQAEPALPNEYHLGTRLVRQIAGVLAGSPHLLHRLTGQVGAPTLVVYGRPAFYARCGFSLERAARLTGPYPVAQTQIARAGDDVPEETLVYPAAFAGV